MSDAPRLTPDQERTACDAIRALSAAARAWALYPPEHPSVGVALDRIATALRRAGPLDLGVTPDTLLIDGVTLSATLGPTTEAAALLHSHDILRLVFGAPVSLTAIRTLLEILKLDPESLRTRGGPARLWTEHGDDSIELTEIDYRKVLQERDTPNPARRDDLWYAIVRSVLDRRKTLDDAMQQRLLEIAGDSSAIAELASEVMAPNCTPDGSPLVTTQAAAVLAAYRHLQAAVSVLAPDRLDEVRRHMTAATGAIEAPVAMEMLRSDGPAAVGHADLVEDLARTFDDEKVAELLATMLALQGQASERLAHLFDTVAPDEPRRGRVLSITRATLNQQLFGRADQFTAVWNSMEELIVAYNDRRYVSSRYQTGLNEVNERADAMRASHDLPPEAETWLATLQQDNVRRLAVVLTTDLLRMETDEGRAGDLLMELASLLEDLILANEFEDAGGIARLLAWRAARPEALGHQAARSALEGLSASEIVAEAIGAIAELDDEAFATFRGLVTALGPRMLPLFEIHLQGEGESLTTTRAEELVVGFGDAAVSLLGVLVASRHPWVRRRGAALLGRVAAPEGVPLLVPLLRKDDPAVVSEAVRALARINDTSATRAIQQALRAAQGDRRRAVIEALVELQDRRVVPVLVGILRESRPLGADYGGAVETIDGLRRVGDDRAVEALVAVIGLRSLFRRRRARRLKEIALAALVNIGTPRARAALAAASRAGDRTLRRLAQAALST